MYDPFLKGVADGFRIVAEVAPTLIALFFAIQIFRSSGALDLLVRFLAPAASFFQIPTEVLPVIILLSTSEKPGIRSVELFLLHLPELPLLSFSAVYSIPEHKEGEGSDKTESFSGFIFLI